MPISQQSRSQPASARNKFNWAWSNHRSMTKMLNLVLLATIVTSRLTSGK